MLPGQALGTFNLWHYMGKNQSGISTYENAAGNTIATQPLTTDARLEGNAQPFFVVWLEPTTFTIGAKSLTGSQGRNTAIKY